MRPAMYGLLQLRTWLGIGPVEIWNWVRLLRESIKVVEVPHQRSDPIPSPNIPIAPV